MGSWRGISLTPSTSRTDSTHCTGWVCTPRARTQSSITQRQSTCTCWRKNISVQKHSFSCFLQRVRARQRQGKSVRGGLTDCRTNEENIRTQKWRQNWKKFEREGGGGAGQEGGREGRREGGREGGREAGRQRGSEAGRAAGREEWRKSWGNERREGEGMTERERGKKKEKYKKKKKKEEDDYEEKDATGGTGRAHD